jgi:hypothetical protein
MNTKITIILVMIAMMLAVSNPSEEDYVDKATSQLRHDQSVAAFWLKPAISAATIRTNLIFCSLYRTEIRNQTHISLGILGHFILLNP